MKKEEKDPFSKLGLPDYIAKGLEVKPISLEIGVRTVRHGRKVTYIKGFGDNVEELEKIAKELKKKLACGGTVKRNEITKEYEVLLQGDHRKKVKEILESKGYKNIEVL